MNMIGGSSNSVSLGKLVSGSYQPHPTGGNSAGDFQSNQVSLGNLPSVNKQEAKVIKGSGKGHINSNT